MEAMSPGKKALVKISFTQWIEMDCSDIFAFPACGL